MSKKGGVQEKKLTFFEIVGEKAGLTFLKI
jgi:hypothetical protein